MASRSKSIEQLRHRRLLLVAEVHDARDALQERAPRSPDRPRSTARSGPKTLTARLVLLPGDHVVDAVADGLAEADADAGDRGHRPAHLRQQLVLGPARPQHDLHLGGVHALHVLVLLGAAGAAAGRDDLGEGEQRLLDLAPQRVAVRQRRARAGSRGRS